MSAIVVTALLPSDSGNYKVMQILQKDKGSKGNYKRTVKDSPSGPSPG